MGTIRLAARSRNGGNYILDNGNQTSESVAGQAGNFVVTDDMIAAGITALNDSGILPWGVSADEPIVVMEIFLGSVSV